MRELLDASESAGCVTGVIERAKLKQRKEQDTQAMGAPSQPDRPPCSLTNNSFSAEKSDFSSLLHSLTHNWWPRSTPDGLGRFTYTLGVFNLMRSIDSELQPGEAKFYRKDSQGSLGRNAAHRADPVRLSSTRNV